MRIGINARMFSDKNPTGIARCVKEVLIVWAKDFPENEYFLLSNRPIDIGFELPDNWTVIVKSSLFNKGLLWEIFTLRNIIRELNLDIFWGTNYTLPKRVNNTKYILSIYDLAAFKVSNVTEFLNLLKLKYLEKKSCEIANYIISISKSTTNDICDIFKIERKKIFTSYCGGLPSNFNKNTHDMKKVNSKLVFKENFFLFIGTIEPRKNIDTILKAYEVFCDNNENYKLVIAGKIGWKYKDLLNKIKNSRYSSNIILPGFINEDDKDYLFRNAKIFLYPSLYEGFGIPILEAFSYNLPVITCHISSIPEVGGDAALYVSDPYDYLKIKELMEKIISLKEHEIRELNKKMTLQVNKFSWKKHAYEIMELLRK